MEPPLRRLGQLRGMLASLACPATRGPCELGQAPVVGGVVVEVGKVRCGRVEMAFSLGY